MQPEQDMPMARKNNNWSDNFGPHEDKKSALEKSDINENDIYLVSESLDIESCTRDMLSGRTSQDGLLGSKSLSFLREIRFSNQRFVTGTLISNIKYNYPGF